MSQINEIEVGGKIYSIAGGGSGGNTIVDTLFDFKKDEIIDNIVTLSKSIKNYDIIYFTYNYAPDVDLYIGSMSYLSKDLLENPIGSLQGYSSRYYNFEVTSETTIKRLGASDYRLRMVYGVKCSSGRHKYSTEEQIVDKWIDGRNIYEKTFTFTNKEIGNWTTLVTDTAFSDYELKNAITSGNSVSPYSLSGGTVTRINGSNLEAYCVWGTYVDTITIQYTKKSEKI